MIKPALIALALLASSPAIANFLGVEIDRDISLDPNGGTTTVIDDRTIQTVFTGTFPLVTLQPFDQFSSGELIINFDFTTPYIFPFDDPFNYAVLTIAIDATGPNPLPFCFFGADGCYYHLRHRFPVILRGSNIVPISEAIQVYVYDNDRNPGFPLAAPIASFDSFTLTIDASSPLPEPSTWALLLFGFAFFGMRAIWPGAAHE